MAKINVLDKNISELIAAGEVIERPASIVKELVENSIDALSTAITIEIRNGGISYIRITDNGIGISSEDMKVAFKRHATSKIKGTDDLEKISTLGFRGEALASIAAVSKIEMTSKTNESQYGKKLELLSAEEISFEDVGCPNGTTIVVKDLFYNVPARLKFLKRDTAEANVISGMVNKLALSHPEISFKLISDFKTKLHTPGNGDLLSAIHAVFGKDFATSLIPVKYEFNDVVVSGYTSNTKESRSNRAMQHFFVNERYVRSKTCMAAIEEAYKNSIMIGRFSFCVINVKVPYSSVDVNVHPAKIEVRFVNERQVFDALYFAIKSAIARNDELTNIIEPYKQQVSKNLLSGFKNQESEQIVINTNQKENTVAYSEAVNNKKENYVVNTKPTGYKIDNNTLASDDKSKSDNIETQINDFQYIQKESLIKPQKPLDENKKPIIKLEQPQEIVKEEIIVDNKFDNDFEFPIKIIGELFKTYVLFESGDNFIMLDKHAAHERILYEKLKKTVNTNEKQLLLKPIVIVLSVDEFNILMDNEEILSQMGFQYEEFGNNTIAIREVPLVLEKYDIKDIILDIATKLLDNKHDVSSDIFEDLLHSVACRSAIKANDTNSMDELIALVRMVYKNDEIRHCPHGRPIVSIMTKYDIEKKFGRI